MLAVSLGGRVLLSADRAATGFGFGGRRASLLLSFAEGAGALPPPPPPVRKALSRGGRRGFCGAGAASAEAQGWATAALLYPGSPLGSGGLFGQ